jgi:hypothetical protein
MRCIHVPSAIGSGIFFLISLFLQCAHTPKPVLLSEETSSRAKHDVIAQPIQSKETSKLSKLIQDLNKVFKETAYLSNFTIDTCYPAHQGDRLTIPELSDYIKEGATTTIRRGKDITFINPRANSKIRFHREKLPLYKDSLLQFIDVFCSETIILEPVTMAAVKYVPTVGSMSQMTNSIFDVKNDSSVNIQIPPYHRGLVFFTTDQGCVLKRIIGTRELLVDKGFALVMSLSSSNEVWRGKDESRKEILFNTKGNITKWEETDTAVSTYHLINNRKVSGTFQIDELPFDMEPGGKIEISANENAIKIEPQSLLRCDIRDNNGVRLLKSIDYNANNYIDYIDLFFPEHIVLNANSLVPIVWRRADKACKNSHFVNSVFTISGDSVILNYPSHLVGKAILSGPNGATFIRSASNPKNLQLLRGEAYVGDLERGVR